MNKTPPLDTFRLIAGVVFAISVFLLVDAWMREHRAAPAAPSQGAPNAVQTTPTPTTNLGAPPTTAASTTPGVATPQSGAGLEQAQRLEVKTDYLIATIDTHGGDLRRVEFRDHKDREDKTKNFVLLQEGPQHLYVAQSGLIGEGMPNHNTAFRAAASEYVLAPGQDQLEVRLEAKTPSLRVVKTYTFHRSSYVIDIAFQLENLTKEEITPFAYFQLVRDAIPPAGDSRMMPTYTGAEVYTQSDKLHKVSFSDIEAGKGKFPKAGPDGWVALVQHYFLAAWFPKAGVEREFYLRPIGNGLLAAGVILPVGALEPQQTSTVAAPLYVGPQEQERLKALAPGLELTVDYGWLRVLAVPLFWVLSEIHDLVRNWGVAIIILTILIKLAFYPLSATSYKSMAKMKVLGPKLQRLKERYGDDRQKLHQAMMEMYKTEKINPLGGCLPIVVQIPVFIALYWVLLLSVELRHATFFLWINDLSRPDPYFVLPVLMGATMFLQTWLNPTPPDPMQARLMKIMPVAFSIFFFFFPSGLVLYWLVNNILSIAQQWQITRALERGKPAHGES